MAEKILPIDGYDDFLNSLKERIRNAQVRAALSVNRELVLLYWQIGNEILTRQQQQGWGTKVIDKLASDLRKTFPDMKGFSARNLKYMRAFAEAYPNEQFVQQPVAQIPWGHNVRILEAVKNTFITSMVRSTNHPIWLESQYISSSDRKRIVSSPRSGYY